MSSSYNNWAVVRAPGLHWHQFPAVPTSSIWSLAVPPYLYTASNQYWGGIEARPRWVQQLLPTYTCSRAETCTDEESTVRFYEFNN